MLELRLLGQFNLRFDGQPIEIPSRPAQSLLAYLVLKPGTAYRRERLAGLLWPDATDVNARSYLRQALWRIRKALEVTQRDYFLTDDLTIAFAADAEHWLDVAQLEREMTASSTTAELLECASVYQGEFLPGFYDEWIAPERERLQAIYEHKMTWLLDNLVAEQRWPEALEWGERWIALAHAPEPAYRALMLAHNGLGDVSSMAAAYQRCSEALQREFGVEPSEPTRTLYEQLSKGEGSSNPAVSQLPIGSRPPVTHNLPSQLTTFIGRKREVAEVKRLLTSTPSRLVTLTGSGGCGKTRLALQAAQEVLPEFPQGVWLIELAPVADPALVTQTLTIALGLREESGRPISTTLIDYLRGRKTLLLLDNCEHLIAASARLVETLLQACPDLTILASSREQLGVAGETAFRVPSLSIPDPRHGAAVETLSQYEAVQLFVDRARLALPQFSVTAENANALAQICQRLDGIPLALELAAARVNVLGVDQIAARLTNAFRLLTGGSRTALPRQQTLRAMMDWSYNLLSEAERTMLRRLAVFAGGWTLEAAEAIGADEDAAGLIQPDDVLDLLTQLVNKSLVIAEEVQSDRARYRLLETIRQYAREKMLDFCDTDCVWDRHLAYFMQLAERAEPELRGPQQVLWLNRLKDEVDNLHAALDWSLDSYVEAGLRLASALYQFTTRYGSVCALAEKLQRLLQQPAAQTRTALRAKALEAVANLISWNGELAEARSLAEASLEIYRELGDVQGEAHCLDTLGTIVCLMDDYEVGRPLVLESLRLYRRLGDQAGIATALLDLGGLADNKDCERAYAYLRECLAISREHGDLIGIGYALSELGMVALRQGDFTQAQRWLEEGLSVEDAVGGPDAMILMYLGQLALRQGDYTRARACFEQGLTVSQETGVTVIALWSTANLGYVYLREGEEECAQATFAEVQQRFREMGSRIGVVYALEGLASLAVQQSEFERAVRLYAWADATRASIGDPRPFVEQAEVDRDYAAIRAQISEEAITIATVKGRAMTVEQAVAYAWEQRTA
ncbi:Putative HTH-type transcriptional regulator [Thermoflexales bacterium]|nr:Putative HTH-type transcriptional regulator [Thermoflexales bacterium]